MSDLSPDHKFSPLFGPGFHDLELEELHEQLVQPFDRDGSVVAGRRAVLLAKLRKLHATMVSWKIDLELWLDGSFVTEKPEPNDIDAVLVMSRAAYNSLSPGQRRSIDGLVQRKAETLARYGTDLYFSVRENARYLSYWKRWFGSDRNGDPKGIVRLEVKTP